MGATAELYVEIGAKIDGLTSALDAVQKQLMESKEKTKKWGEDFSKVGKEMAVVGGAIVAALTGITIATALAGDNFDEMSAKTGISTEVLSTLKLAADKSGTSIDAVASGMKFLATQMIETSNATDKSKTVLGMLGIAATDANGQLRPMNDVLFDVADRFKGMEAGALKTKLAVTIFGKSGMDMIPILDLGSKGLKENEEAAKKLGIEWSGASSKAAAAFADSLEDLKAANVGLGKTIAEALMPTVKKFVDGATAAISGVRKWAAENPELTKSLTSVALGIGFVLANVGATMVAVPKIVSSFSGLAKMLSMSAASLGIVVAGLTVLVAAAILAYNTINDLTKAKEYAVEADFRAYESNRKLGQKLREVSDAAGITRAEFVKLTEKYDGNNAALAMAIKRGDEGTVMQKALAKVGAEHAAVLDKQKEKTGGFDSELRKLIESLGKGAKETKSLKDELGLIFTSDLKKRIQDIETALVDYKGLLSPESEKKLRRELTALYDEMSTGGLALAGLAQRHRDLKSEVIKVTETIINTALPAAHKWGQAVQDMLPVSVPKAWKETADQIIESWGNAIASIIVSTADFSEKFKALITGTVASLTAFMAAAAGLPGPVAQALGAVIGSFAGLESASDKAVKSIMKAIDPIRQMRDSVAFLGAISDELSAKLLDLTSKFGQAGAEARLLGDIMRETGIDAGNFDIYLSKATNTLTLFGEGLLTAAEASESADDQFAQLLAAAQRLGQEGSIAMVNFIVTAREMGLEIASVTEYVQGQLNKIPSALETMVGKIPTLDAALGDLNKRLAEQEAALAAANPWDENYESLAAAVRATRLEIQATTLAYQGNLDTIGEVQNAGVLAVATFNSMIASGMTWGEALAAVGPTLATLKDRYTELGIAADPALQELMNIAQVREENIALFDSIDANLQVMQALANTGFLTAEALAAVESNARNYYDDLLGAGMSADEATRAMLPSLQAIYDAHVRSGEPIDENTQKLIDQAIALGLIKPPALDPGETMARGFDRLAQILEAIGIALGATIPAAAEYGADAISASMGVAADGIGLSMDEAAKTATKAWTDAAINTAEPWEAAISGITDGPIQGLIDGAKDAAKVWKKAAEDSSNAWDRLDVGIPTTGKGGSVGAYASGGVAWTPQLATIAEHEPEVIIPMSDYKSGTGLAAGVGTGAGATTINLTINAQTLDDQTIRRASEKIFQAVEFENRRRGRG